MPPSANVPSIIEAQIEVFRLCVRVNRLRYEIVRDYRMTPKLQGLAEAMKKLEHDLEDAAGKLMAKVEALGPRSQAALTKSHQRMDAKAAIVGEIESFVSALEGANGGDPLDDSSTISAVMLPAGTITGDSITVSGVRYVSADEPEKLTVNGVSTAQ